MPHPYDIDNSSTNPKLSDEINEPGVEMQDLSNPNPPTQSNNYSTKFGPNKNYWSERFWYYGPLLFVVVILQIAFNMIRITQTCTGYAGNNIGHAILLTLGPWILIFGVMISFLINFPAIRSIFSNVIGSSVIYHPTKEYMKKINNIYMDNKQNQTDTDQTSTTPPTTFQKDDHSTVLDPTISLSKSNVDMYYNNNVSYETLANNLSIQTYMETLNYPSELMYDGYNLIKTRDIVGDYSWLVVTGILSAFMTSYQMAQRGCVRSTQTLQQKNQEYAQKEDKKYNKKKQK